MAGEAIMRLFRATYRDREGATRTAAKWYVDFRDHLEQRRRLPAFTDRKASAEFARKIEELLACRVAGERPKGDLAFWLESLPSSTCDKLAAMDVLDQRRAAATKPLADHLADWRSALAAKGDTPKHVRLVTSRAERLVTGCGFRYYSDIASAKVQEHLADLQPGDDGVGAQTRNFYLSALRQFCKWMVSERRAAESPISHLKGVNVRTDRRHDRRALSVPETQRLLGATRAGKTVWRMTGHDREMVYRIALETGLRWGELRSLTRSSFDLDGEPPHGDRGGILLEAAP